MSCETRATNTYWEFVRDTRNPWGSWAWALEISLTLTSIPSAYHPWSSQYGAHALSIVCLKFWRTRETEWKSSINLMPCFIFLPPFRLPHRFWRSGLSIIAIMHLMIRHARHMYTITPYCKIQDLYILDILLPNCFPLLPLYFLFFSSPRKLFRQQDQRIRVALLSPLPALRRDVWVFPTSITSPWVKQWKPRFIIHSIY